MRRFLTNLAAFTALQVVLFAGIVAVALRKSDEYVAATRDKERRLSRVEGRRIVFVGGSNLAFGLRSDLVERALQRQPVNMGLYAPLGLPFLFRETKAGLRTGDVVVLSLEYDYFFNEEMLLGRQDRQALQLLIAVNPAALRYVDWSNVRAVFGGVNDGLHYLGQYLHRAVAPPKESIPYARHCFNVYGDLILPSSLSFTGTRASYYSTTVPAVRARALRLTRRFIARCAHRGVKVFCVMPPLPRPDYEANAAELGALEKIIARELAVPVLLSGREAALPAELFFDTHFHLNARGARQRTVLLASRLRQALDSPPFTAGGEQNPP